MHPKPDLTAEWRAWWRLILRHHRHIGRLQSAALDVDLCSCGKPVGTCIFRVMAARHGLI